MNEIEQFLQDFYGKYAPKETLSPDRVSAIKGKYGNDYDSLVKDLYGKYASGEQVTPERLQAIKGKYKMSEAPKSETPSAENTILNPANTQPAQNDVKPKGAKAEEDGGSVSASANMNSSSESNEPSNFDQNDVLAHESNMEDYFSPTLKNKEKLSPQEELYVSMEESKKLTPEQEEEINTTIQEESQGDFGMLETVEEYATPAINFFTDVMTLGQGKNLSDYKNPYQQKREALRKEYAKKSGKNVKEVSEGEIKSFYLQKRKEELVKEKQDANVENFIEELPEEDKEKLEFYKMARAKQLSNHNQFRGMVAEERINRAKKIKEDIEGGVVEGTPELVEEYNNNLSEAYEITNQMARTEDDLLDEEGELDLLKRNYGQFENFMGKGSAGLLEIAVHVDKAATDLNSMMPWAEHENAARKLFMGKVLGNPNFKEELITSMSDTAKDIKSELRLTKSVTELENLGDVTDWVVDISGEQAANIIMLATTGGAGLGVMGASAYGSKLKQLEQEEDLGLAEYTPMEKRAAAFLVGGAEILSERVSLGLLNKTKRYFKAMPKGSLSEVRGRLSQRIKKDWLGAKTGISGATSEGSSEVAAQLSENIVDKYLLGKEDTDLRNGLVDAFAAGAFMGTLYRAPQIGAELYKPFIANDTQEKIGENLSKIDKLNGALENASAEESAIIGDQIAKLDAANTRMINGTANKVTDLEPTQVKQVLNLEKEMVELRKKYTNIINSPSLDKSQKDQLVEGLQEDYAEASRKKNDIINNPKKKDEQKQEEQPTKTETTEATRADSQGEGSSTNGNVQEVTTKEEGKVKDNDIEEGNDVESESTFLTPKETAKPKKKSISSLVNEVIDKVGEETVGEWYMEDFPDTEVADGKIKPKITREVADKFAERAGIKINEKQVEEPKQSKLKGAAQTVRKAKFYANPSDAMKNLQSSPAGVFTVAWDGAMETIAKTLEATDDIAQAVESGLETLRNSEWYKNLSKDSKKKAERFFESEVTNEYNKNHKVEFDEKRSRTLRVPNPVNSKKPVEVNLPESVDTALDFLTQKFVDAFHGVKTLQKNLEKTLGKSMEDKANFRRAEVLLHGKASNVLNKFENTVENLGKKIAKSSVSSEQVSEYLYARHAKERNKYIKEEVDPTNEAGSGMTDTKADEVMESFSPKQMRDLENIARDVDTIMDKSRDMLEEFGLESKESVENLRSFYKHYVPLQGFAKDDENGMRVDMSRALSVKGKETRRAAGRKSEAYDVLSNIIAQHTNIIVRGHKNEVMQTLYQMVKDNPNSDVWNLYSESNPDKMSAVVNGKKTQVPVPMEMNTDYVGIKVKGKKYYVKFKNKNLAKAINSANVEKTNLINRVLGGLNRYLSMTMTTLNPEFVVSNFARDIQTAMYNQMAESDIAENSLKGKDIVRNTIKSVTPSMKAIFNIEQKGKKPITEHEKFYAEFKEDGAKTGWFYAKSADQIKKDVDGLIKMYEADTFSAQGAKRGMKSALNFVENVNSSVENAVRLAAYMEARKAGVDRLDAAEYAKELTVNFNKSGEWGTVANSLYLFFNAAIQGTARFARAMTTLKKTVGQDGGVSYGLNKGQKVAAGISMLSSVMVLLNRGMSDEDEDGVLFYDKIPDYEKERNFIIMNPANGKDYFKIPLPYGYNIFSNFGTVVAEVSVGSRDVGDATGFMVNSVIGAFSPINFTESQSLDKKFAKAVTPTSLKPVVELAINENFFGSTIYNENLPFGTPKPESSLGRRSTPEAFKQISEFLNEATGGSNYVSGDVGVNPDKLHYLFDFATGGTGKFIGNTMSTAGAVVDKAQGEPVETPANKIPFVRKVYAEPNKYVDQEKYYDRRNEINQLYEEWKRLPPKETKGKERYDGVAKLKGAIDYYDKALKAYREDRDFYRDMEDPIKKTEKLNKLEEKYFGQMKKFNKLYNKLRGD